MSRYGLMAMMGLAGAVAAADQLTAGGHRVIPAKVHARAKAKRKQQKRSRRANR